MVDPKGKAGSAQRALADITRAADMLKGGKTRATASVASPGETPDPAPTGLEMKGRGVAFAEVPKGTFTTSVVGRGDAAVSIGGKEVRPVPKVEESTDPARVSYDNAWKYLKLTLEGGVNRIQPKDLNRILDAAKKAGVEDKEVQAQAKVFFGLQMARLKQCVAAGDVGGLEMMDTNIREFAARFDIELQNEGPAMFVNRERAADQAEENAYVAAQAARFTRGLEALQDGKSDPLDVLHQYAQAKPYVTYTANPAQNAKELDDAYAAAFQAAKTDGVKLIAAKTLEMSKLNGSVGDLLQRFDDAKALLAYSDNPKQDLQRLLAATDIAVHRAVNNDVATIRRHYDNCGRVFVDYSGSSSRVYADARYRFEGISEKAQDRLKSMEDWLYNFRY